MGKKDTNKNTVLQPLCEGQILPQSELHARGLCLGNYQYTQSVLNVKNANDANHLHPSEAILAVLYKQKIRGSEEELLSAWLTTTPTYHYQEVTSSLKVC